MSVLRASASCLLLGTFLLAAPAVAGEAANAQTIQVQMSNYDFAPRTLELRVNTAYRLRLTNTSHSDHSFDAPQLFAAASIEPADQAKVADGDIEVNSGKTVEVTFTPIRSGTYMVRCSHFLHSAFGMKGEAVVR